MSQPLTVLMAVHNGEPHLQTAMESILSQSYRDFRFLIVDDASTDRTREIIRAYDDSRIELVALPRNIGQTAALNLGLRQASTPWIARMDADDYSAPTRLAEQMEALAEHPDVRCLGTFVWEFRDDPAVIDVVKSRPVTHEGIRRAALCGSGMIHGSIVISRDALLDVGAFDERYRYASDRDMFLRFLERYRAMNLPRPLFGIRRHPSQDSFSLRAAEEYLDVCQRLVAADRQYSPVERAVLRESLAFCYLFQARCLRTNGRYAEWWKNLVRAAGISPSLCVRNIGGTIGAYLLPKRRYMTLRVDATS
ncbi:MAG: glycosyltransferase [Candidatus Omnitrophica bacterium]|nr:glycosyltransferase [Candidatus Omnitrophota bacterium]